MPVEDVFTITGRGTVATGRVERGIIKVGDNIEIVGMTEEKKASAMACRNKEREYRVLLNNES